jgi:hypothetical protein
MKPPAPQTKARFTTSLLVSPSRPKRSGKLSFSADPPQEIPVPKASPGPLTARTDAGARYFVRTRLLPLIGLALVALNAAAGKNRHSVPGRRVRSFDRLGMLGSRPPDDGGRVRRTPVGDTHLLGEVAWEFDHDDVVHLIRCVKDLVPPVWARASRSSRESLLDTLRFPSAPFHPEKPGARPGAPANGALGLQDDGFFILSR